MVAYPGLINNGPVPATPTNGVDLFAIDGAPYVIDSNGSTWPLINTLRTGSTTFGAIAETINHNAVSQTVIQPASGELQTMSVELSAGELISAVGFCIGVTAAVTPTHWWAVLLDSNYKQLAHTADQLTAPLAASTWQKAAFTAPFTTLYTGTYFVGIMISTGVTQPSLFSATVQNGFVAGVGAPTPGPGGRSSTGLTVPGTDGSTVYATPAAIGGFYYAYLI